MAQAPQPKFQLTIVILLSVVAWMHAILLIRENFNLLIAVSESAIAFILLYAINELQSTVLSYYTPTKARQFYIIIWAALFAAAFGAVLYFLLHNIFPNETIYQTNLQRHIVLRSFVALLIICSVGFYNLLWHTQRQQLEMQQAQGAVKELAKDAELYKLRMQIQPHFLFNSLNSITALISLDPPKARKMIQQLSEFLRATLRKEDKELISLSDELHYIQVYLEIEKVRFGDRLNTHFNIPENCLALKVPNLILQPVLENAIKYGLYNQIGDIDITLSAEYNGNELQLSIANPFDASEVPINKGTGFGLNSIKRRLQLVYGSANLLQIEQTNTIFTTRLTIPQF
jgi:two-component system, LytTR family, sensor kinase